MSVVSNIMEVIRVAIGYICIGLACMFFGFAIPMTVIRSHSNEMAYFDITGPISVLVCTIAIYWVAITLKERLAARLDITSYTPKTNVDKLYGRFNKNYEEEYAKGMFTDGIDEVDMTKTIRLWMFMKLAAIACIIVPVMYQWGMIYGMTIFGRILTSVIQIVGIILWIYINKKRGLHIYLNEDNDEYLTYSIALMNLMDSRHVWQIEYAGNNNYPEANYNITRFTKKTRVRIDARKPGYIKSDLDIVSIRFNGERWMFVPGGIMVVKGFKVKMYDYSQLRISGAERSCADKCRAPEDAVDMRRLHKFINRNDSRDMRYTKNPSRWVYRAGIVMLELGDERNAELQVSNVYSANNFLESVYEYEYYGSDMSQRDFGKVKIFTPAIISRVLGV